MFFGNKSGGLTSFWPEQIVEKPSIPPVVLTAFSLVNRPVAPGPGSLLTKSITSTQSLTLSHEQNHMFSFEFAALSYVDPATEPVSVHARRTSTIPGTRWTPITGWLLSRPCPRETTRCAFRARTIAGCGMSRGLPCNCRSFLPGGPHGGFAPSAPLYL